MPVLSRLASLWRTITRGTQLDADLDQELRAHVDLLTDEKIAAGLSPEAARRAALLEVGGVEQVKERVRDVRVGIWLETVWQDIRYAARGFRKAPWFTVTAITSLALGIGLNSALFSAIEAAILRPLPYPEPDRVVSINQVVSAPWGPWTTGIWPAVFDEWQRRSTVFETVGFADQYSSSSILRDGAKVERVDVLHVSSGYLSALGVRPALGRTILPEDDRPGSAVAVVTDEWWRQHSQADRNVLGRSVLIDGRGYTIVGVMPPGFRHYHSPIMDERTWSEMFLSDPWASNPRTNRWLWGSVAIGRLKPGITLGAANAQVKTLAASTDYGENPTPEWGPATFDSDVRPLWVVPEETGRRLWLIGAAAVLVLLLTAMNVANLQLARSAARAQEIGVRAAIGASRGRLLRQFLTESMLLSVTGGLAGLILAAWSAPLLTIVMPDHDQLVRLPEAGVNAKVLAFTFAVAIATGIGFGVLPAMRGSRRGTAMALAGSRRSTVEPGITRGRSVLLVVQLALSLVLLAGAGLMITTFARLQTIPLGYDPEGLVTFFVLAPGQEPYVSDLGLQPHKDLGPRILPSTPLIHYSMPTPLLTALPDRLVDRLQKVPGVRGVTVATGIPNFKSRGTGFSLPGRPAPSDEQRQGMRAWMVNATPGYFSTLGMRVLYGRGMTAADQTGSHPVVVIDRQMARKYWTHETDALGDYLTLDDGTPREIVGIVNDVRFWVLDEHYGTVFMPYVPVTEPVGPGLNYYLYQNVAVRVSSESTAMMDALRRAVAEVTGGLPIERVRTARASILEASGSAPAMTLLLSSSAGLAVLLAAIGIFGVVSYDVSQRTHEIGIRVALGASPRAILRLVLAGGLWLALAGVAIGLGASYWATRLIASELYQVSPTDPRVFASVAVLLVAVVLVACWAPARRAAGVDPLIALRAE